MEPDVMRLYSSSPPPLDEGAEEDDDEFGDFGGFGGALASSFSFSELETPPLTVNESQVSETGPPAFPIGSSAPGPCKVPVVGRTAVSDPLKQQADKAQVEFDRVPRGSEVIGGRTEACGLYINGDVAVTEPLANGFRETDAQDASVDTTAALSSSSPCVQCESEDGVVHRDASQHKATSAEGTSLANGFAELEEDSEPRDEGTLVEPQGPPGSGHTEASEPGEPAQSEAAERPPSPSSSSQDGEVPPEDLDLEISVHPADEELLTPSGPQESSVHPAEEELPTPSGPQESSVHPAEEELPTPSGPQESSVHPAEEELPTPSGPQESSVHPAEEELPTPSGPQESSVHPAEEELPTPSGPLTTSGSDDFASFCEVVSPSDLEEFGDFGDFSSTAPAATSEEPTADAPEDDEDFGGFEEPGTHATQGFADFSRTEFGMQEEGFASFPTDFPSHSDAPSGADVGQTLPQDALGEPWAEDTQEDSIPGEQFGDLPISDSFADFQSVPVAGGSGAGGEWAAFGEPLKEDQAGGGGGDSWAAFGEGQAQTTGEAEVEESQWQDGAADTAPTFGSTGTSRRGSHTAPLSSRLQALFQASFPHVEAHQVGEETPSLKALLEPQGPDPRPEQSNQPPSSVQREPQDMWQHLQEIHGAFGLKFLWGGSHSNRQLLHCLAMDTRNIVFAGQKKRAVIVPTYAASLGMLEPTKDPVKATSAAGQVAASAQAPPGAPDSSSTPPKPTQEAVASVQPDWSSSGLKPPLDGSTQAQPLSALELNLDYFGPEEDNSSGNSTPPAGVDPELYKLTTVTLESGKTGEHIADAFTRLMSTVEQNSTSTRKPVRDENLSEEAARVLSVLPSLSFMRAKVLMFPSILAPQPPDSPS